MSKPLLYPFLAMLVLSCALLLNMPALAEEKIDLIGGYNDWDAFSMRKPDGEKICYMVSRVKSWKASKSGVKRGEVYLIVTHRPKAQIRDQVNIVVGYPFKDNSQVSATIDGKSSFTLFTQGDGAWLFTSKDDADMVRAMRRGNTLIVKGESSRGTKTTDRYSLAGFTAAHNAISRVCPR